MRGMIALTLASSSSFACPWLHSGLLVAQIWQTSLRPSQCHLSVQHVGQRNVSGIILLSKLAGVNCHTNTITISVHNIQLVSNTCNVNADMDNMLLHIMLCGFEERKKPAIHSGDWAARITLTALETDQHALAGIREKTIREEWRTDKKENVSGSCLPIQ